MLQELGSGTGEFLATADCNRYESYGVEPNKWAAERTRVLGVVEGRPLAFFGLSARRCECATISMPSSAKVAATMNLFMPGAGENVSTACSGAELPLKCQDSRRSHATWRNYDQMSQCSSDEPKHDERPSVLVLVLASREEPWRSIESYGQRQTWARKTEYDSLRIRFYYGKPRGLERALTRYMPGLLQRAHLAGLRRCFLRSVGGRSAYRQVHEAGDSIVTSVPETYLTIGAKSIAALRFALEKYAFDYVLRTNTSSYVNLDLLVDFCASLEDAMLIYGGHVTNVGADTFASGSGILLNREAVRIIVRDPEFDFSIPDDVAIGRSLNRGGATLMPVDWIRISSRAAVSEIAETKLHSVYHFRCKGSSSRFEDIAAMNALHDRLVAD